MRIYFQSLYIVVGESEFEPVSAERFNSLFTSVYENLRRVEHEAVEGNAVNTGERGCFCRENDVFLKAEEAEDGTGYIDSDDSIFVRKRGGKAEFIARRSGYPVIHNGRLSIYTPCRITPDKVHLFYIIFPVNSGRKMLLDDFFLALSQPSKDHGMRSFTSDAVMEKIDSDDINILTISKGLPANPGRRESLAIRIRPEKEPKRQADGSVDYYSFSIFKEVEEGAVLAEKITGIQGSPGLDAYGNEIPVPEWRPVQFSAGENVAVVDRGDGRQEFIAKITGVLDLKKTSVGVLEELNVVGDVCVETGSIDFSRNVNITGNVHSLYRIKCGGNLTIKGMIENGSSIECAGDFFAEKGIIGDKTKLFVKGRLETDYINDVKFRVLGDLLVHGTVYSAEIFCGGFLTVEGKKMKTRNRGCIVGSRITSMKGMTIHSAGSPLSKTVLICGIDQELKSKMDAMQKTVPAINKKIIRMQNNLGIDLSRKDVIERLRKLPPEKKEQIKRKLQEIKNYANQKGEIESRIEKMQGLVMTPDLESLSIRVGSHLLPDTTVIIGDKSAAVKKDFGPVEVTLSDSAVIFNN